MAAAIAQPNARNFNEIKKAIGILEENNSALESRLEDAEKENNMLKESINSINNDLKFLQNGMKEYYDNISKAIHTLSDEVGEVSKTIELIGANQKNHDTMNYDLMKKMLMAQESMFSNVIALLEAHSIIDEADSAIYNAFQLDPQGKGNYTAVTSNAGAKRIYSKSNAVQNYVKTNTNNFDNLVSDFKSNLNPNIYKDKQDDGGIAESSKYLLKLTVLQFMREHFPHDISSLDKIEKRVNEIARSYGKYERFLEELSKDPQRALKNWGFTTLL